MSISGSKKNGNDFVKSIGLGEFNVINVNPTKEEMESLGFEMEKEPEYLGEKDGNTTLRVNVWLKEVRTGQLFSTTFFLENKQVMSKDGSSKQYINSIGKSIYCDSVENLPEKFTAHTYHVSKVGESELVGFLDAWLDINKKESYTIELDWSSLMKGNLKEVKDLMKTDLPRSVVAMATIRISEKSGEKKEYQSIYNRRFLPGYTMKFFRAHPFAQGDIERLRAKDKVAKETREWLKPYEKFVVDATDPQYGIKDAFYIGPLKPYNPEDHLQSGPKVLDPHDSEY